jgi:hypothetical protein
MNFDVEDYEALESAVITLEQPGFAIKIFDLIGKPIEYGLKRLPMGMSSSIENITKISLEKAFLGVTANMSESETVRANKEVHRGLATLSGAVGGAFGLPALAVELPVSTGLILRSIAEIARESGEQVKTPETQMACLEVFALGGKSDSDDAGDSAYFATRLAIASQVNEAAKFVARQSASRLSKNAGPPLIRLISQVASRFGVTVTEKTAAQMVPVLGAVGGAGINFVFIKHYQEMAGGHFTVRRLERKYGEELVSNTYHDILDKSIKKPKTVS